MEVKEEAKIECVIDSHLKGLGSYISTGHFNIDLPK